ncbi:hypothetical protein FJNA_08040 [Thermus sp. FJN-A]
MAVHVFGEFQEDEEGKGEPPVKREGLCPKGKGGLGGHGYFPEEPSPRATSTGPRVGQARAIARPRAGRGRDRARFIGTSVKGGPGEEPPFGLKGYSPSVPSTSPEPSCSSWAEPLSSSCP